MTLLTISEVARRLAEAGAVVHGTQLVRADVDAGILPLAAKTSRGERLVALADAERYVARRAQVGSLRGLNARALAERRAALRGAV